MESRERFGDKKEDENIYGGMTQETQECQKHLLADRITEVVLPWKSQKELDLLMS